MFVFGDNDKRTGRGKESGQAVIRDNSNALGIRTKKSPYEFYTDKELESNKKKIDHDK